MPRIEISDFHKDQLLNCLMYHLPQDMRATLMVEVPAAYNAICGREVVSVVRKSDGCEISVG